MASGFLYTHSHKHIVMVGKQNQGNQWSDIEVCSLLPLLNDTFEKFVLNGNFFLHNSRFNTVLQVWCDMKCNLKEMECCTTTQTLSC